MVELVTMPWVTSGVSSGVRFISKVELGYAIACEEGIRRSY